MIQTLCYTVPLLYYVLSYHSIVNVTLPSLQAFSIIGYSLSTVAREFNTLPTALFSPTKIQPCESSAELPACINTPENEFTFNNLGVNLLNLGEKLQVTSYVPYGIAVSPYTFYSPLSNTPFLFKSRTASSNVSQKYTPSIYSLPIVYLSRKAVLLIVIFIRLPL
nr:MAG TPA: hypothetical protein [Bacteriophage sp.]